MFGPRKPLQAQIQEVRLMSKKSNETHKQCELQIVEKFGSMIFQLKYNVSETHFKSLKAFCEWFCIKTLYRKIGDPNILSLLYKTVKFVSFIEKFCYNEVDYYPVGRIYENLDREKLTPNDNKSEVSLMNCRESNKTILLNKKIKKNDLILNN